MNRRAILCLLPSLLCTVSLTAQTRGKKLTVELITNPRMLVSPWIQRVGWRPGAEEISYIRPQGSAGVPATALYLYDVAAGKERQLFLPNRDTINVDLMSYQWSPKGDSILFQGAGDLWLFSVRTGQTRRLTRDPAPDENPTLSPDGTRVAYVMRNNLYSLDLASGRVTRLTQDGSPTVWNGKLDWVYEEELANRATNPAYQWSPDGRKIAYLRLDDGPVPTYPITNYLPTHVSLLEQRFPQAGDPNPLPSVRVVDVDKEHSPQKIFPLPSGAEYIGPNLAWTPDSKAVVVLTLNRHQDDLNVHEWSPVEGTDRRLIEEEDPYWINAIDPPYFLKGGQQFLWLSERDGWLHLYLFGSDGHLEEKLTRGDWMIDRPLFSDVPMFQVDEAAGWVYFSSTDPDPRERQLWRVRLEGGAPERISRRAGSHSLTLAPDGKYVTDSFSDVSTPPETFLLKSNGTPVATLDKPANHLSEYSLGKPEFVEVKARDGATLYARLLKPADFNPGKKYPAVVYVYGGPHVQMVRNEWSTPLLLDQLFAQNGFLVWTLDNRGSWGRGHKWESAIFEHLGRRELQDQMTGVDYLKSLPYVDASRIGIRGWSYGGYLTLYALTHAPDAFKCGAAGGPVTDWKYYDSIYTERYMRTPAENPDGYRESSPLEAAANLRAKVLLIHGADDDNVHMQNTMNFINALVDAGKAFDLYIQPGQKHGFAGVTVNEYLNQRLLEFFKKNL